MLGSASFSRDCSNPEANAAGGMALEVTISPSGAFMYGVAVVTTTTRGVLVASRRSQRVNHCIVTVWTKPALAPLPDVSQHVIKTEILLLTVPKFDIRPVTTNVSYALIL
jgi:hypothetical protein